VKPVDVAWYASHYHTADGLNEPYQYSYLFAYAMDGSEDDCVRCRDLELVA
jgi:alpha-mannosidase